MGSTNLRREAVHDTAYLRRQRELRGITIPSPITQPKPSSPSVEEDPPADPEPKPHQKKPKVDP